MRRLWAITFTLAAATLGGPATADAGEKEAADAAKRFWAALAAADLDTAANLYAPEVLLKAGSELLKPEWSVHPEADRSKDLLLGRDELIAGYRKLIDRVGRQRWAGLFTKIDPEKISFRRVRKVDPADRSTTGMRPGDLVMTVATGPGDDALLFVLREHEESGWLVVVEATDY